MPQGERIIGKDSCRIEKFIGPPDNLKKEEGYTESKELKQPKRSIFSAYLEENTPKFQGKVKI